MEKQSRPGDAGSPGRSQDWEYRQSVGQTFLSAKVSGRQECLPHDLEVRALFLDEGTNPLA